MACNGETYIPIPARVWNRVDSRCAVYSINPTKQQMLIKGNILQYKKNSASLSKKQLYSKIAKGEWINRSTTWAIQNDRGYTNPNSTYLKRINGTNIAIDRLTGQIIGPTSLPLTCPTSPQQPSETLPIIEDGGGGEEPEDPELPPIEEPTDSSGNTLPEGNTDTLIDPIVISDGGNLICSITEIPCSNYTKTTITKEYCNPTTASNVPGKLGILCWDETFDTWYIKNNLTMPTSNDKWPETKGPPNDPTYIAATSATNLLSS